MTTLTHKTGRIVEALAKLIDQFKAQPNIEAVITATTQQSQELEDAGFEVIEDTLIDTAEGIQLDNLGTIVGVERSGMSDADYRVRIGAQILLNGSSGTIEDLLELIVALGAVSGVVLTEYQPARINVVINAAITNGEEIAAVLAIAKAAGVALEFTWYESLNPFLFDTAGQGFDQGELGEMIIS